MQIGGVIYSVDAIDAYMYQLQQNNAIASCDNSLRVFVVQEFSSERLSLKVNNNLFYSVHFIVYIYIYITMFIASSVLLCVTISTAIQ